MNTTFTHYNKDPLYTAAATILEGKSDLDEGVEEIKNKVSKLKVGDKTNFGLVVAIGSDSVTFKTKDIPKTKISFNQRKMGSKDFVLDRLGKLKEDADLQEGNKRPLPKDIEDYANKIEMFSYASKVYNGMMDVFGKLDLPKAEISIMVKRALDDIKKIRKGKNESVKSLNPSIAEAVSLSSNTLKGQVLSLLLLNNSVRVAHWRASTVTNAHEALGDLYTAIDTALDRFAETEMGISRNRNFDAIPSLSVSNMSNQELVYELRERVEYLVSSTKACGCEDLINIAAEMLEAINKASYLLEV